MRNEYNMKLDGNGYAKSILQEGSCCHLCGRNGSMDKLDRHEVFGGPDRCHLNGVHKGASLRVPLQREAQMAAMKKYKWDTDEFIRIFGRSYL